MAAPKNTNIKEIILDGATKLLEEKSFFQISLSDIAKKAGISKGTLYYYYSNKDDLLFDIADNYLTQLSEDLIKWVTDESKDTSLPRLIKYTLERGIFNESGNLRLYLIADSISGNEELREKLLEKYQHFKNILSVEIAKRTSDADSEYLAWLILIVMDGLLVQDRLQNKEFDVSKFIEKIKEQVYKC